MFFALYLLFCVCHAAVVTHTESCFKDGLEGLTEKEIESINDWEKFYDNHKEYKFVGYLKD